MSEPARTASSTGTLSHAAPPQPVRGARVALSLLVGINVFNYVDRQLLASVESDIRKSFSISESQMGIVASVFLIVYMTTSPIFGWLADRGGRWRLVGLSIILQSIATLGTGLAQGFTTLLLMRCAVGVGEACYAPVAPTLISDMFEKRIRGRVLAWFYAAIPVGSALGYVVGGLMLHWTGDWRWAFYVVVLPGIAMGICCFFFKDPPRGLADNVSNTFKPSLRDYLDIFRIKSFFYNCAGMTAMTFAIGGISFWMATYLREERGIEPGQANIVMGLVVVVSGLSSTLLGGWLADRLRTVIPGSYFVVCGTGMLLGFPLFLLVLVTPFPACWGVLFAACFSLFLNTGPGSAIIANVTHPSVRATAFALNIFVIHCLGDVLAYPLLGWIKEKSSLQVGFVVVSVMMAVGGVVWLMGAKHLQRDTENATRHEHRSIKTWLGTKPPVA